MFLLDKKIKGFIYYHLDGDDKIPARLFKESEKLKLELLNTRNDFGFGISELKGVFEENSIDKYYITFLNCSKKSFGDSNEVEFSDYIIHSNFSKPDDEKFITLQSKTKEMSFDIANFEHWIWYDLDRGNDYQFEYLDKNKEKAEKNNAEYYLLKTFNQRNSYSVKYKDINASIQLISEFGAYPRKYPQIVCEPYTYVKISTETEQEAQFFIEIIDKLNDLFSLFFNQKSLISNIQEFEAFNYRITYHFKSLISNDKQDSFHFLSSNILFKDIKDDLSTVIQNWFDKYDDYKYLIHSICEYDNPKYLDDIFSRQVQLLETYGNIKSKGGGSTRVDIFTSLNSIEDDLFKKIFFLDKDIHEFDVKSFFNNSEKALPIENIKKNTADLLMNIRNHFTHPYRNGNLKTPLDDNISEIFIINKSNTLDYRKIKVLSNSLKKAIDVILFKELEINVENHSNLIPNY